MYYNITIYGTTVVGRIVFCGSYLYVLPIAFRQAVLLTLSPVKCVNRVLSPWVRRAGREADYCRASSTEEEECMSLSHTFS
jgi:hypothetical protein